MSNTEEKRVVTEIYFCDESQTAILMKLIVSDVTGGTDSPHVVAVEEGGMLGREAIERSKRFTLHIDSIDHFSI